MGLGQGFGKAAGNSQVSVHTLSECSEQEASFLLAHHSSNMPCSSLMPPLTSDTWAGLFMPLPEDLFMKGSALMSTRAAQAQSLALTGYSADAH